MAYRVPCKRALLAMRASSLAMISFCDPEKEGNNVFKMMYYSIVIKIYKPF
jgi:hypothetical protein